MFKSNKPRILTIGIPFDANNNFDCIDALTIPSNTIIYLSNIGNTKRYKFSNLIKNKPLSLVFKAKTEQLCDLKLINISNDEYLPIEYVELAIFIPDDNTIAAKFDYSIGEKGTCLYYYPKNVNFVCGKLLSLKPILPQEKLLSNSDIIQYLKSNICNGCGNQITKDSISSTLVYYLIPCYLQNDNIIQLHCFNCLNNRCSYYRAQLGWIYLATYYDEIKISNDVNVTYFCNDGKYECCNVNVLYNKEYVEDQLQKMKIPQQLLDYHQICIKNKISYDDFDEWHQAYTKEFYEKLASGS